MRLLSKTPFKATNVRTYILPQAPISVFLIYDPGPRPRYILNIRLTIFMYLSLRVRNDFVALIGIDDS
jgi:hypothetical protein